MYLYMIMMIIPVMILIILIFINYLFSMKSLTDREKPSPFECGFNPLTNTRLPFSIQFFITMIIFLIFDMEIILLIPLIPSFNIFKMSTNWFYTMSIIMIILFIGLFYEWNEFSLIWMK